jgi:hypothetical protein
MKARLDRRRSWHLLVAISAHQMLARSLLTIGSMQQSPRCLPRYRIHEHPALSAAPKRADQASPPGRIR